MQASVRNSGLAANAGAIWPPNSASSSAGSWADNMAQHVARALCADSAVAQHPAAIHHRIGDPRRLRVPILDGRSIRDFRGVEKNQVGEVSHRDPAPLFQSKLRCWHRGRLTHCFLQIKYLALPHIPSQDAWECARASGMVHRESPSVQNITLGFAKNHCRSSSLRDSTITSSAALFPLASGIVALTILMKASTGLEPHISAICCSVFPLARESGS